MFRPTVRALAGAAVLAAATGMSLSAPANAQGVTIPEDPCDINYFPDEEMWEISWGAAYYVQRASFDKDSYGGLTAVNGGDVPAYIADAGTWRWWYVTREGMNAPGGTQVDLEFADGTHWRGEAVPDANGCPAVTWTPNPPEETAAPSGSLGSLDVETLIGSVDVFGSLGTAEEETAPAQ